MPRSFTPRTYVFLRTYNSSNDWIGGMEMDIVIDLNFPSDVIVWQILKILYSEKRISRLFYILYFIFRQKFRNFLTSNSKTPLQSKSKDQSQTKVTSVERNNPPYRSPSHNHRGFNQFSASSTNSYQRFENFVISLNDRLTDNRHGVSERADPHYRASWSRSDRYTPRSLTQSITRY